MSVACAAAASAQPVPPDLHGALIVSSTYRYYASILYGSDAAARGSALAACHEDEPRATCAVYASFKNQCVAVAANGAQHVVAIGEHAWDGQRTGDYILGQCRDKTGSECRLVLSACSTQAQQLQDQGARAGQEGVMQQDFLSQYVAPLHQ
ncbi:DUF4189 domain-containing protein [Achromobacter mucicolens]|uniref:DUF4189 domain-containing protein n=1 Tax=Achromobacter mucicolens TaxID=1389922 RepID=UPI002448CAEA|nr:DUF4189 domain-containing protein [Achromobacter mucicolens]MDH0091169.1 DUF4189 domain-containing protein [Achromobacter mucicolens]